MTRKILSLAAGAALAWGSWACSEEPPPEEPAEYPIRGEIVELKPEEQVAVIDHEEIPGWMGAMRMGFPVRGQAEFQQLEVGDWIEGTVFVRGLEYSVGALAIVDPPAEADEEPEP